MKAKLPSQFSTTGMEGNQLKLPGTRHNLLRLVQQLTGNKRPKAHAICENAYSPTETHNPPKYLLAKKVKQQKTMLLKLCFMREA